VPCKYCYTHGPVQGARRLSFISPLPHPAAGLPGPLPSRTASRELCRKPGQDLLPWPPPCQHRGCLQHCWGNCGSSFGSSASPRSPGRRTCLQPLRTGPIHNPAAPAAFPFRLSAEVEPLPCQSWAKSASVHNMDTRGRSLQPGVLQDCAPQDALQGSTLSAASQQSPSRRVT
jgi:hypothetical protein